MGRVGEMTRLTWGGDDAATYDGGWPYGGSYQNGGLPDVRSPADSDQTAEIVGGPFCANPDTAQISNRSPFKQDANLKLIPTVILTTSADEADIRESYTDADKVAATVAARAKGKRCPQDRSRFRRGCGHGSARDR
jgi:hypothetical protein